MRIIHYNSDESTKKYIKRKRTEERGGEGERRGDLAVAPDVGLNGHLKG
jgi:hypothetical protein